MQKEFPYTISQVMDILHIEYKNGRKQQRVICPFCKRKDKTLSVNLETEKFNCFRCGFSGVYGTKLYAHVKGCDTKTAYAEITDALGIGTAEARSNEPVKKRDVVYNDVPQASIATIAERDDVYKALLSSLPLMQTHKRNLLSRGFRDDEIKLLNYASFPGNIGYERKVANMQMVEKLRKSGHVVEGIPGFYRTLTSGKLAMGGSKPGIMVPYVDFNNKITGIQIRKNDKDLELDEETGKLEHKYYWFSTNNYNNGCGVLENIHYACDFRWLTGKNVFVPLLLDGSIIITEGAMKADLTHCITGRALLAIPGVNVLNHLPDELEKLKGIGLKKVYNAFDMDYLTNPNVEKAQERLKELVLAAGLEYSRCKWPQVIPGLEEKGNLLKGIDDFYAFQKRGVIPEVRCLYL